MAGLTRAPTTLRITLEDIRMGGRLLRTLPGLLAQPIVPQAARAIVAARLADRDLRFLRLVKRGVYEYPQSPYRTLLALAGCEYGDLAGLVAREGVEGALGVLFQQGVYLTVEEFKGRRAVERWKRGIDIDPRGLRNPDSMAHIVTRSGGSRGPGSPVPIDVRCWWDRAVDTALFLVRGAARGGAMRSGECPGARPSPTCFVSASPATPPFGGSLRADPAAPGLHPRYRWGSARLARWASKGAGVPLPRPEHVPVENPLPIARWMAEVCRAGELPHLVTFPSSAVRIATAALDAGLDVAGGHFMVAGEPITSARLTAARRVGAELTPYYAASPCGHIAYGCQAPEGVDDLHLLHDLHALIQPSPLAAAGQLPAGSLLITELLPTTPMIVLNISLGDHASLTTRRCGCPLERVGWTTHLSSIQSHEKLTAGGMTFLDTDVIRVLEEVLPARFGGGPTTTSSSKTRRRMESRS